MTKRLASKHKVDRTAASSRLKRKRLLLQTAADNPLSQTTCGLHNYLCSKHKSGRTRFTAVFISFRGGGAG